MCPLNCDAHCTYKMRSLIRYISNKPDWQQMRNFYLKIFQMIFILIKYQAIAVSKQIAHLNHKMKRLNEYKINKKSRCWCSHSIEWWYHLVVELFCFCILESWIRISFLLFAFFLFHANILDCRCWCCNRRIHNIFRDQMRWN